MSSEPSPFLTRPGAVGDAVPQHYGNPIGEQRALESGIAIVDLSDRSVIAVSGPDRLTWLDSMTSQQLSHLQPGESTETLVLDPNGRVEHAARVLDDGETAWLLVDGAQAAALEAWLQRMRFMLRVTVADRSTEFATIGAFADGLVEPATAGGIPLQWVDPWAGVVAGGHQYAREQGHPASGWHYREVLVPRAALGDLANSPLPAAGTLALEALRVAAWRPRLASEGDEKTLPHELDWLRTAVHLNKGCYRGQETVAKVHNLGHPPRRLVMLHLDGSDAVLPAQGDDVVAEGAVVGRVTSAAMHHELGPIALAIVKRTLPADAALIVRSGGIEIAAAQEVIVPPSAGATVDVPRLPRLGSTSR